MQTYRNNLSDITSGEKGKGKLYGERDKLMRAYERMKSELQTYENNIGFLSISSKGGGGLVKEMERKIEKLKEEMALIIKKIDAIDENLE
jgi:archaellum component FlaC